MGSGLSGYSLFLFFWKLPSSNGSDRSTTGLRESQMIGILSSNLGESSLFKYLRQNTLFPLFRRQYNILRIELSIKWAAKKIKTDDFSSGKKVSSCEIESYWNENKIRKGRKGSVETKMICEKKLNLRCFLTLGFPLGSNNFLKGSKVQPNTVYIGSFNIHYQR